MPGLRKKLREGGIIIMDGATGTQLQQMGLPAGMAPELWNLQNPEAVKRHYQAYVDAGCDAILTNTFGGTRPRLDMEGSGHLTYEINLAAAQLAREVAGSEIIVLGSMGPTGLLMDPMGDLRYRKAQEYYAEQAEALADGGVNGIHIETLSDLEEAKAAVAGAHMATDLPVTITMSFDMHGRTMMGVEPGVAAKVLWEMGVIAVGANCGRSLEENLMTIAAMRAAEPGITLIAKPNAGLPHMEDTTEAVYDVTPEIMAEYSVKFADQHVKILGGCCGSTPAHLKAVKDILRGYTPPPLDDVLAETQAKQAAEADQQPPSRSRERRRERRRTRN